MRLEEHCITPDALGVKRDVYAHGTVFDDEGPPNCREFLLARKRKGNPAQDIAKR